MSAEADPTVAALLGMRAMKVFVAAAGRGFVRRVGAAWAVRTEVPAPTLNGVWALDASVGGADLERAAEEFVGGAVPYCFQARPGCRAAVADVAERHGLLPEATIPLMVGAAGESQAPVPPELKIRSVAVEECRSFAELCAEAFHAPADPFAMILTERALASPGVRAYVGEVGGEAVATGMGITLGGAVAVMNIATIDGWRRRGYGAAMTARAIADGHADGATWSWLQSTDLGIGIYERLGFSVAERWTCWVGP